QPNTDLKVSITHQLDDMVQLVSGINDFSGPVLLSGVITGDIMNPDITLEMNSEKSRIAGMNLDSIHLSTRLRDRILSIDNLMAEQMSGSASLTGQIDARAAFPGGLFAGGFQMDRVAYDVLLTLKHVVLDEVFPDKKIAQGQLDVEIQVSGKGISRQSLQSELSGQITGKQVRVVPDVRPSDIDVSVQAGIQPDGVTVRSLKARTNGIDLDAKGQMKLSPFNFSGDVHLNATNLAQSLKPFGITDIAGSLRLKARVDGLTGGPPKGNLVASGNGLSFHGVQIGDMDLNASLEGDGFIDLKKLEVHLPDSSLLVNGRIGLFKPDGSIDSNPAIDLNLVANHLSIVNYFPDAGASGLVNADLKLSGRLKQPFATLNVQGRNLMVKHVSLGRLNSRLIFSDGFLVLDKVSLNQKKDQLTATGRVQFQDTTSGLILSDPVLDLSINGKDVNLSHFISDIKGHVSIQADIQGTVSSPSGRIKATVQNLVTPVQDLARLELNADMADRLIRIQSINAWFSEPNDASAPSNVLTISGQINPDKQIQLEMTATDIPASGLGNWANPVSKDIHLTLNARIDGDVTNPVGSATLILSPARSGSILTDPVPVGIELRDHIMTATTTGMVSGSARYDLKTGDVNLDMNMDNAGLSPVFRLSGLSSFDGQIAGRISATGNINRMISSTVDVSLSTLRVTQGGARLIETDRLNLTAENGRFFLNNIQMALLNKGSMSIRGQGDITGSLDVTIQADIPLSTEWKTNEYLSDLGGTLKGDIRLTGPTKMPAMAGMIQIQDAEFILTSTGQRFHQLNADIDVVPERIRIESFQGKLDDGTFQISGSVDMNRFKPVQYDIQATASALPINVPETFDGQFNADLTWNGPAAKSLIKGQIAILDSVYYRKVEISPLKALTESKRSVVIRKPLELPEMTNFIELDVLIVRRGQLRIDNNVAQCDVNPNLHVTGTLAKPIVTGRATIETGTVFYYKKQFEIKKGVVDFSNPYRIVPVLDIAAESQISQWLVRIALTGPIDELVFKLTSTPPLESGDLLSLIIMGKTSSEMIRAEGGNPFSTQQVLSTLVDSVLADDIRHYTGLDILQVEPQSSETGGSLKSAQNRSEVLLSLGKNITPRISIRYTIGTRKGESVQRTIADYQVLENLIVSGFQDSRGSVGGEIKYRHEFR
ncbi:MAG: translocation/assembly module TamB domain-containing protein, partial [Desulfatirhabdiaceae bacterium]